MKIGVPGTKVWRRRELLVLAAIPVVHAGLGLPAGAADRAKAKTGRKAPQPSPVLPSNDGLPPPVAEMREAILEAVHTGRLEDLKTAIELNELKPDFGAPAGSDPIAFLRTQSAEGTGADVLAAISLLFDSTPAVVHAGRDLENSAIYVWPSFAETGLDNLTPSQQVALYRLVRPDDVKAMRAAKRWTWWRIAIAADGTWHSFARSGT